MIEWFAFATVSDNELNLLVTKQKFINFFKLINELCSQCIKSHISFPTKWLITSVDKYSSSGLLRYPKEHGNHYDSNAVDIVPLTDDLLLSLPISLNRNLFLMDLFTHYYNDIYGTLDLPILAFEADHLHLDVNHQKQIVRLRRLKPFFEKDLFTIGNDNTSIISKTLNDGSLIRMNGLSKIL